MAQAVLATVENLELSQIKVPKDPLRTDMGQKEFDWLKESMTAIGLLEPIIVRRVGSKYEVVAGSRRLQAARDLGWPRIQASVVDVDDKQAFLITLTENVHRKTMDGREEGRAYVRFTHINGWGSVTELAGLLHVSLSYISDKMRLADLSDEVFTPVKLNKEDRRQGYSEAHAEELGRLNNEQATLMSDLVITKGLTSDQTRKAVNLVKHADWEPEHAVQRILEHPEFVVETTGGRPHNPTEDARESITLALGQALHEVDSALHDMPEGEEHAKLIHDIRYPLHQLQDVMIRHRKQHHA